MGETEKRPPIKKLVIILLVALLLLIFPICELLFGFGVIKNSKSEEVLSYLGVNNTENEKEFAVFLSVGQGDSAVIKSGGKTLLIDFGLKDESDSLYWTLKSMKISKIDFALITHAHKDHLGGFTDLAERMGIENLIINTDIAENADRDELNKVIAMANTKNIKLITPKMGDKFAFGNAFLEILYVGSSKTQENNRSVVSRVNINGKKILFMGDTEDKTEKDFLNKCCDFSADILKLGHHGAYNASGYDLLKKCGATVAVASSGYNNLYGHPSEKVLERLEKQNIACYRTDLDGNIRCEFNEKGFTVFAERKNQ